MSERETRTLQFYAAALYQFGDKYFISVIVGMKVVGHDRKVNKNKSHETENNMKKAIQLDIEE